MIAEVGVIPLKLKLLDTVIRQTESAAICHNKQGNNFFCVVTVLLSDIKSDLKK